MELWIRSQKKTRLIKVNNILAYDFEDGSYGIQINGECFVGEYTTEERVLEVLDNPKQFGGAWCLRIEKEGWFDIVFLEKVI